MSAPGGGESWTLVAPDWAHLDTVWRSPLPFVLWPVCDKTLLGCWLDEAVRRGIGTVCVEAADRPHLVRGWLDQRDLWSRAIEVHSQPAGDDESERILMDGLPGSDPGTPSASPAALLRRWYDLQVEALGRRDRGSVHLDHEIREGVWAGPGARIDASAVLTAPCRVGAAARVGPGCRLGPGAFVGDGAFLDEDVEVRESIVCADTYVGAHTTLERKAAQGGLLLDFASGAAVEIADEFILRPVRPSPLRPGFAERFAAGVLAPLLEALARSVSGGRATTVLQARLGRHSEAALPVHPSGPLCLRRAAWLREVAAGRMRLSGVLPRSAADWDRLAPEVRTTLEQAPTGVFALSDLYQCHSAEDADEWTHAVFQAGSADGQALARRNLLRIAMTTPMLP